MTKKAIISTTMLLILIAPTPAWANVYIPSFVQFITAPLLWSIYVVTMAITLPVIFAIAFIEALVVKRYSKHASLWHLTTRLAAVNALTSLVGTVTMPTGTELWPGLLIAFVITVFLEAPLLYIQFRKVPLARSAGRMIRISFYMNAASYSVLAVVLAGLIYIPAIGAENRQIGEHARGRLILEHFDDIRELDLNKHPRLISDGQPLDFGDGWHCQSDGKGTVACGASLFRLVKSGSVWKRNDIGVSRPDYLEKVAGVSLDGRLLYCKIRGKWVVYDTTRRKRLLVLHAEDDYTSAVFSPDSRFIAAEDEIIELGTGRVIGSDCYRPTFSPDSRHAAWIDDKSLVLLDCPSGKSRRISIPGTAASPASVVAWNPDGQYVAYLGHSNPYTAQRWTPDVRVVRVTGKGSATVHRRFFTAGAPSRLVWLR